MSANFFAALDDSGDEAPAAKTKTVTIKEVKKKEVKKVVEPSKLDDRKHHASSHRNDRNTKFGRGGRVPARDGKRAYDRRSGTGRGKEIKKGGGGARNWGSDKNDARAAEHNNNADARSTPLDNDDVEETVTEEQDDEHPEPEPAVPEVETMSYEEFMAKKKEESSDLLGAVKARAVNTNDFASVKASEKEEEDFLVLGAGKARRKKTGNKKDSTAAAELLAGMRISSGESSGGRGGRGEGRGRGGRDGGRGRGGGGGGRGGREGGRGREGRGRGGRGRGGGGGGRGREGGGGRGRDGGQSRSGRGRSGGLNVQDESAFPSL